MSLDDTTRREFLAEFDRTGAPEQSVIAADFDTFLSWGRARLPAVFEALGQTERHVLWQAVRLTHDDVG